MEYDPTVPLTADNGHGAAWYCGGRLRPYIHNLQLAPVVFLSGLYYQMADGDLGLGIFAVWGQSSGISSRNQSSTENRSVQPTTPNYQGTHTKTHADKHKALV